jgi:cyclic patellamide precursor peptide PatG
MHDTTETAAAPTPSTAQDTEAPARFSPPDVRSSQTIIGPQVGGGSGSWEGATGSTPNSAQVSYVYVIGRVEARFPNLSAEKEFAQATGRTETAGKTNQQTFHAVLSKRENRYLARQLCWVLTVQGMETYLLVPHDPTDIELLIEAVRPVPSPNDIDVVIGMRGPMAPPEMCNGLIVPIVAVDQMYSFDREALIKSIPKPDKTTAAQFAPAAEELFNRIMQLTDNAGATEEHRALNYLTMRYPAIYAKAAEQFAQASSLTGVEVLRSPLTGTRVIVEVIFAYTNRNTDFTEKFCVRVDVTEEFPFLVTKMSPYYDR